MPDLSLSRLEGAIAPLGGFFFGGRARRVSCGALKRWVNPARLFVEREGRSTADLIVAAHGELLEKQGADVGT